MAALAGLLPERSSTHAGAAQCSHCQRPDLSSKNRRKALERALAFA